MANELKRATGVATDTGSTIYTVPVGATATIIGCRAANKTANDVDIHFTLNGFYISGANTPLPAGTAMDIMVGSKIVAQAGDEIVAFASVTNTADIVLSYLEQS